MVIALRSNILYRHAVHIHHCGGAAGRGVHMRQRISQEEANEHAMRAGKATACKTLICWAHSERTQVSAFVHLDSSAEASITPPNCEDWNEEGIHLLIPKSEST